MIQLDARPGLMRPSIQASALERFIPVFYGDPSSAFERIFKYAAFLAFQALISTHEHVALSASVLLVCERGENERANPTMVTRIRERIIQRTRNSAAKTTNR